MRRSALPIATWTLSQLITIIGVLHITSCGWWPSNVPLTLREQTGSCEVLLSMRLWKDRVNPWVGVPAIGWTLTVTNRSAEDLSDCVFIMNDRYQLALKDATIPGGFGEGRKLFGRSTLHKGETITLGYSNDGGNLFVDADHNVLDYFTMPTRLTLKTSSCTHTWDLLTQK